MAQTTSLPTVYLTETFTIDGWRFPEGLTFSLVSRDGETVTVYDPRMQRNWTLPSSKVWEA